MLWGKDRKTEFSFVYLRSQLVVVLHVHRKTICQQFVILDNCTLKNEQVFTFVKLENFTPCAFSYLYKSFTLKFVFKNCSCHHMGTSQIFDQKDKRTNRSQIELLSFAVIFNCKITFIPQLSFLIMWNW